MIEWIKVDKNETPTMKPGEMSLIFYFDSDVYTGWPLVDAEECLDERDDDGYPIWSESEGSREFHDVRWYAHWNHPPKEADKNEMG